MKILSMTLVAAMVAAGCAQARQGSFHLPFEARWGKITLAPGDYKIALPQAALGERSLRLTGQSTAAMISPMVTDVDALALKPDQRSYLQLVNVDGVYFVSKFQSGASGAVYGFKIPKAKHRLNMADRNNEEIGVSGN